MGVPEWNSLTSYLRERRQIEAEAWDQRIALICCVIANVHRSPRAPVFRLSDFMPNYDMPRENAGLSPEQMLDKVTSINRMLGGADMREGDMRK